MCWRFTTSLSAIHGGAVLTMTILKQRDFSRCSRKKRTHQRNITSALLACMAEVLPGIWCELMSGLSSPQNKAMNLPQKKWLRPKSYCHPNASPKPSASKPERTKDSFRCCRHNSFQKLSMVSFLPNRFHSAFLVGGGQAARFTEAKSPVNRKVCAIARAQAKAGFPPRALGFGQEGILAAVAKFAKIKPDASV